MIIYSYNNSCIDVQASSAKFSVILSCPLPVVLNQKCVNVCLWSEQKSALNALMCVSLIIYVYLICLFFVSTSVKIYMCELKIWLCIMLATRLLCTCMSI